MPPPTESSILTTFLIPPAPLPEILSLPEFTELFPKHDRGNPQVPALYRELQHQRALVTDQIRDNIKVEVKRGERSRREVVRARRRAEAEELHGVDRTDNGKEVEMETVLFGTTANLPTSDPHTLASVLTDMEEACADVEAEIAAMETEARGILRDMEATVGDLSDLRYGRFYRPSGGGETVGKEILNGLKRLEEVCDRVGGTT